MLAVVLSVVAIAASPPTDAPSVAIVRSAVTPPRSPRPLQSFISPMDYPEAARKARQQGDSWVALDVSPEGRVTACAILKTSGSAELDRAACMLLQRRARFTPARDAAGAAMTGQVVDKVRWRL